MGHIYKRCQTYWIKYFKNGKPYYESSRSRKEADARRLLKKREGDVAKGRPAGVQFDRVRFEDLKPLIINDYIINGKKFLNKIESIIKDHLGPYFKNQKVVDFEISAYITHRISEGAANATINRELSALQRMLNLGAKRNQPLVDRVPHIPKLKENNAKQGFLELDGFKVLRSNLPDHLQGFVTFGFLTGWRLEEIAGLQWKQVNRKEYSVRLEPGTTKNDEGRLIFLDDELKQVIETQWSNRKKGKKLTPYVFTTKAGNKLTDIRKSWNKACRDAGIGYGYKINKYYVIKWHDKLPAGPTFHDFRRSTVRNLVRSGVSENTAMMVTGHKTRSVFDRYDIIDENDLKNAVQMQRAYLDSVTVTDTVTVQDFNKMKKTNTNG